MMAWNLKGKIIDIETSFLSSDLEESIFMKIASDVGVGDGKFLILKKIIYALV
jgi:hypothetical protein